MLNGNSERAMSQSFGMSDNVALYKIVSTILLGGIYVNTDQEGPVGLCRRTEPE